MTYDPTSALRVVRQALKSQQADTHKGLLDAKGEPVYTVAQKPDTLCIRLQAFTDDEGSIPPDFADVEKTAKGLQAHERPDGGCFVGAFDAPHDPLGVVLVYGDSAMSMERAMNYSLAFRRKLTQPRPTLEIVQ